MSLRLRELIKDKGISSISALAEMSGITQASMSNIINEKASPSLDTLQKIASALNVELWELFTAESSKNELTALIDFQGKFYKANNVKELVIAVEDIISKDEQRMETIYTAEEIGIVLDGFTDDYKVPFAMNMNGYSYEEIGKRLGLSTDAVKSRIYFARKKLIESLKENRESKRN